mmetsp:Transcript_43955/g.72351  ORF Transcript_43955/g.72351 Transcript_43955/m.72351 type:complete len:93 (+) Transcript_43955:88-366(+)
MMILGILILLYCRTLPSSVRKPIQHDYCLWRKDWECDAAVYVLIHIVHLLALLLTHFCFCFSNYLVEDLLPPPQGSPPVKGGCGGSSEELLM